ncbi:MAG: N-6 DNA methylase [Armatimonadota bacterium]|nr:N-6 DNA methylase [Armatimonadota bacterium]
MLKQEALRLVETHLDDIGYNSACLERDFPIPSARGEAETTADLVAFSDDQRKDQETACIAAQWCPSSASARGFLEPLSRLACPIGVLLRPAKLEVLSVHTNGDSRSWPRQVIAYDDLEGFLRRNCSAFEPRTLLLAKRTRTVPVQGTLFDHDPNLLDWAREVTATELNARVGDCVAIALEGLASDSERDAMQALEATIRLVAAQAICEKLPNLFSQDLRCASAAPLLEEMRLHFPGYFPPEEIVSDIVTERMLAALRTGMTYRALTNDVLSDVYENVLLEKRQDPIRKRLGIHYTPAKLARQILNRLPVEVFPPEDRHVFDPTCGSGSFLRAAYDRLGQLLPGRLTPSERHDYLAKHLRGMDADPVAREIAALSLVLHSLPSGNSWDVMLGDFLTSEPAKQAPTIIVGNPPFGGDEDEETGTTRSDNLRGLRRRKKDRAVPFLRKSLDVLSDGGLLAMVLPESFLSSPKSREGRCALLKGTDIFELWHLPRDMMPLSTASTVVVFARKQPQPKKHFPVKVQWTIDRDRDRQALFQEGSPSFFTLASAEDWVPSHKLFAVPRPLLWKALQSAGVLVGVASVTSGQPVTGAHPDTYPHDPTWRKWLGGPRRLRPYACDWSESYPTYVDPASFDKPRSNMSVYDKPKVIVNQKAVTGGNPWRLYGAVDRDGLLPRGDLYCVIPRSGDVSLEHLAAIVNSSVANAFLYFCGYTRTNTVKLLEQIPFPSLTNTQLREVERMVQLMSHLDPVRDSVQRFEVFRAIDSILLDAYGLSYSDRVWLAELFADFAPPKEDLWRLPPHDDPAAKLPVGPIVTGVVEDVDACGERMRVWFTELEADSEGIWIPVPADWPGWALHCPAHFSAQLASGAIDTPIFVNVSPLDYGYLSDEELLTGRET